MIRDYKPRQQRGHQKADVEALPPHDEQAERSVLTCIFMEPTNSFEQLGPQFTDNSFYVTQHKILFSILHRMRNENRIIDTTTVVAAMREAGEFDKCGGFAFLGSISGAEGIPSHLPAYAQIVRDHEIRRQMIQASGRITSMAMEKRPVEEILTQASSLSDIELPTANTGFDGLASSNKMVDDLERRFQLRGALSGLDTGFQRLNEICEGLQPGEQAIIGARPSMGKTALGLDVFYYNAIERQVPSLFITHEMSVAGLMRRMLSKHSHIPLKEIRRGSYTQGQFDRFMLFQQVASQSPMHIVDATGGMTITEVEYHVRRYVRLYGIRLVVLDYLQKVKAGIKHEKRTYEVGDVSERLKGLYVETNVAGLTLAQLNREPDKDKGRTPRLNDLADSGQIERDADLVGLLHRDKLDPSQFCGLIIAKQRDGELGTVPLDFDGDHCCFRSRSPLADVPIPTYLPTDEPQELSYADN